MKKIRVRSWRTKITNRIHIDSALKTLAHGGYCCVSWEGQCYHGFPLEVRVLGKHIWKANDPDSTVAYTYDADAEP